MSKLHLYDRDGYATKATTKVSRDIRKALTPVIKKWLKKGVVYPEMKSLLFGDAMYLLAIEHMTRYGHKKMKQAKSIRKAIKRRKK